MGKLLGRNYESTAVCSDFVLGEKLMMKSESGLFFLAVATALEEAEGGTKVTSVYRGESRGFFKLVEPIVVRLTKRQFELAVENFKALLEAGEI